MDWAFYMFGIFFSNGMAIYNILAGRYQRTTDGQEQGESVFRSGGKIELKESIGIK